MPRYKEDPNDRRPRQNVGSAFLQSIGIRGNRADEIDSWAERQRFNNQARLQKEHLDSVRSLAEEQRKIQSEIAKGERTFQGAALRQFDKYLDLGIDYNDLPPEFLSVVTQQR